MKGVFFNKKLLRQRWSWGNWPVSLQGYTIISLKGCGSHGMFLMTGKTQTSDRSSGRVSMRLWGTSDQSFSYQSLGRLWSKSSWILCLGHMMDWKWLGAISMDLQRTNPAWATW